ncbi:hypothetical protein D3C76_1651140 [compost metagenome]
MDQGPGAQAVVNDVVLQVDAGLGVTDQFGAGTEGLVAVGQQTETGPSFIGCGLTHYRAAEG